MSNKGVIDFRSLQLGRYCDDFVDNFCRGVPPTHSVLIIVSQTGSFITTIKREWVVNHQVNPSRLFKGDNAWFLT